MRVPRSILVSTLLILVGATAGCPSRGTVTTGTTGTSGKATNGAAATGEAAAEDLLKSAIHQLRPENYTIAAASDKPVNLLNSWHSRVPDPSATAGDPTPLPAGWVDEVQATRLKASGYDLSDAVHVRDAMLTHAIALYLAARATDDVGQIQAVFDFTVRNIALRGPNDPEYMPLGIYDLLLLGSGTPEDRAWVCADILKQLRIDSVIVRPAGDAGTDAEAWLIGVLLNGKVYLFDPRLGLAIPSTSDAKVRTGPPATLDEIVAHPEWLEPLAVRADQPYAIDAETLKTPQILPIVEADYWSPRMRHLESVLPADDVCVLFDPPVDEPGRVGLLSRLQKVLPGLKPGEFRAWPYPLLQLRATGKMDPAAQEVIELARRTFSLPFPVQVDESQTKVSVGRPEYKLLRIRTDHLLGKFDDANKRYLSIRHLELDPMQASVPQVAFLNRLGAENAFYWTCLCKFESEDYEAAIEQLDNYVKRYERNGRWIFAARALLADCHAQLGHFPEAAATLGRTRSDDPYRDANAVRVKRWSAEK